MRWKCRKPEARKRAWQRWHDWFAWYPVRVPTKGRNSGQRFVWLEIVRRQRVHCWGDYWISEYKELSDD
jgi:hypothetical protein